MGTGGKKAGIVFAHGLWADGSCFQKVVPALQADGHEVICSQHGLDSLKGDVDCVTRCFGRVSGPIVLVGHSYGGTLITHAGVDDRVGALVYICALAPDENETSQQLQDKFPTERPSSAATFPKRIRSWSGQRKAHRCLIFSTRSMMARRGARSRAGTSWAPRITP
jgi:pimeloyl-ACP methyl ester carboxylesterase